MTRTQVIVGRLLLLCACLLFWEFAAGDLISGVRLVDPFFISSPSRIVLDAQGPCRVVDGDKVVGVIDDEDILRVVVAEEGTR
jgi:ABC-type nitrate/sulfonate/bicarbonate transport system permease component